MRIARRHNGSGNARTAVILAAGILLQACGGGGGGGGTATLAGHVLDEAITNASVEILDGPGGQQLGYQLSHADGSYSIAKLPTKSAYLVQAYGGRIGGRAFAGTLSAYCSEGETCDVTPLTTLAAMAAGSGGIDGYRTALTSHRVALGLPSEDPFVADSVGHAQTAADLVRLRARIGDGAALDALLKEIQSDIADGALDDRELRTYFPNARRKTDLLLQRAEAIQRGDSSVPLTPASEMAEILAPSLTPEAQAREVRLARNQDLVMRAVDPEPSWISSRASSSMLIVGPGEAHSVDLVKLDNGGNSLGPVDKTKLRIELRIQRDENTIDYVPEEFQSEIVGWDETTAGRLNIHVPAYLNRGRLLIGVRPNFKDAGQAAIAERWSVPVFVDVWPLNAGVITINETDVYYPLGSDAHFRDGSAFDAAAITTAMQQAGLEAALKGQPLKGLVVKGRNLQEGQLVDYRLPDAKGGIYPYGGRVVKVIAGADDQQLALVDFDVPAVYDLLLGASDQLVKEGVLPEFVSYRSGNALPASPNANTGPDHFGPGERATIQSGPGSIIVECLAGIPPSIVWTPVFEFDTNGGVNAGVKYSLGIQGANLECTLAASVERYTVPFGGPIGVVLEKITGTGVTIGPYGEMKVGLSSNGTGFTDLTISGEATTSKMSPPQLKWNGSLEEGLEASPIVVKASLGGELGLQANVSAVNAHLPFIGDYNVSYENRLGWVGSLFGEAANAAAVKGGGGSSLGTEFGIKFSGAASDGLTELLKKFSIKANLTIEIGSTATGKITADYNLGDVYDDGNGTARAVLQPANDTIRLLTTGNGTTDGYASLDGSSVYNDPNKNITYELSECEDNGGKIETPLIACMGGFFCGNVSGNAKLCGGQVFTIPVRGSGEEGEEVTEYGIVGVKPATSKTPLTISVSGSPLVPEKTSFELSPGEQEEFRVNATCPSRGVYRGKITAMASADNQDSRENLLTCTCAAGEDCDRTWASPHLVTADGMAYDYIASGDYILQRVVDQAGQPVHGIEVQARFLPGYDVSWPQAAAMQVGEDVVEVYTDHFSPPGSEFAGFQNILYVKVNGELQGPPHHWHAVKDGSRVLRLPSGGIIFFEDFVGRNGGQTWDPRALTVVWPQGIGLDGYGVQVSTPYYEGYQSDKSSILAQMEIQLIRPASQGGRERGMLGNNDGDPSNDFMRRNGQVLNLDSAMSWTALYGLFGGDWLVRPHECLFSDGCVTHPDFPTSAAMLTPEQRALGEVACAGLVGYYREACIHDVGLSGEIELVRGYYANTEDLNWMATRLETPISQLAVYTLSRGTRQSLPEATPKVPAYRLDASVHHVQGAGKYLLSARPPRGASATFTSGYPGALDMSLVGTGDLATAMDVRCGQPDPNWATLGEAWPLRGSLQLWAMDPLSGFAGQILGEIPLDCSAPQNLHTFAGGTVHSVGLDDAGHLWAWGGNIYGEVGDGTNTNRSRPVNLDFAGLSSSSVLSVVIGARHTLLLTETGEVWGWGYNTSGQLGDGTTTSRNVPARVNLGALGGSGVTAVAAGSNHSIALDASGRLWAWGYNGNGQLGDGSTTSRSSPVAVNLSALGGAKVVSVVAGDGHTLALDEMGRVWAWGLNNVGMLGDGTLVTQKIPVAVDMSALGNARVSAIAARKDHSLALDDGGRVWAWGGNSSGQLGDGTMVNRNRPVAVNLSALGNASVISIAAGSLYSLALDDAGRAWAWGTNTSGKLGDGTGSGKLTPVAVNVSALAGAKVVAIEAGQDHGLLADDRRRLWAWGYNVYSQIGDGSVTSRATPVLVGALSGGFQISANEVATAVTLPAGQDRPLGTLRVSSGSLGSVAVQVLDSGFSLGTAGTNRVSVPTGESSHNLLMRCDTPGERRTLGYRLADDKGNLLFSGQVDVTCVADVRRTVTPVPGGMTLALGNLSLSDAWVRFTPADGVNLAGMPDWEGHIVSHGSQVLSLTGVACPLRGARELGTLTFLDANGEVLAEQTVMAVEALCGTNFGVAQYHNVALDDAGHLFAWGNNEQGVLGVGIDSNALLMSATPLAVDLGPLGGVSVKSVSSNKGSHTLAVDQSGRAWAWGYNGYGQLGDGTTTARNAPVAVDLTALGGAPVMSVVAGSAHSLALDGQGRLWAWGDNSKGQLGDGTTTRRTTPVAVNLSALDGAAVVAFTSGGAFNLLLDDSGRVWAWGNNQYGQLGDGTLTNRMTPVLVNTAALGAAQVVSLAAAGSHAMAIDEHGGLWGWGSNSAGELGDGTTTNHPTPVAVDLTPLGNSKVLSVVAGGIGYNEYTVALDDAGRLWSWGSCYNGVLGRDTNNCYNAGDRPVPAPVDVTPLGGVPVVALAGSGDFHSVVLDASGRLWAWGYGWRGVLGPNPSGKGYVPSLVGVMNSPTEVSRSDVPASVSLPAGRDMLLGTLRVKSGRLGATTIRVLEDGFSLGRAGQKNLVIPPGENPQLLFARCETPGVRETRAYHLVDDRDGSVHSGQVEINCEANLTQTVSPNGANGLSLVFTNAGTSAAWVRFTPSAALALAGTAPWEGTLAEAAGQTLAITGLGCPFHGRQTLGVLSYFDNDGQVYATKSVDVWEMVCGNRRAAGGYHSLATDASGRLWAWGLNWRGQLGDGGSGYSIASPQEVDLSGLSAAVVSVAAGYEHSLALDDAGQVWSWGQNGNGQLGDGSRTSRSIPMAVELPGAKVVAVAAGAFHSLALDDTGRLWAWGANGLGALGDGTTIDRLSPLAVDLHALGGAQIVALSAGSANSYAIDDWGRLWGWGEDTWLSASESDRARPVQIDVSALGGAKVISVNAGYRHTMILDDAGRLWGWGFNAFGQVGDGTTTDRTIPVAVDLSALGGAKVVSVAAGMVQTIALDEQGRLWAWGANDTGELGDGTTTFQSTPVAVHMAPLGGAKFVAIRSNGDRALAFDDAGRLWGWGGNSYGQLGNGSMVNSYIPVQVDTSALGGTAWAP